MNWNTLQTAISGGFFGEGDFPYPVSTLSGGTYMLSWADRMPFIGLALGTTAAQLAGGRALKAAVAVMTTSAELNAFVDPR